MNENDMANELTSALECESFAGVVLAVSMEDFNEKFKLEKSFARQCTSQKGPKKFGQASVKATLKEAKQLHNGKCFCPIDASKMTQRERQ